MIEDRPGHVAGAVVDRRSRTSDRFNGRTGGEPILQHDRGAVCQSHRQRVRCAQSIKQRRSNPHAIAAIDKSALAHVITVADHAAVAQQHPFRLGGAAGCVENVGRVAGLDSGLPRGDRFFALGRTSREKLLPGERARHPLAEKDDGLERRECVRAQLTRLGHRKPRNNVADRRREILLQKLRQADKDRESAVTDRPLDFSALIPGVERYKDRTDIGSSERHHEPFRLIA